MTMTKTVEIRLSVVDDEIEIASVTNATEDDNGWTVLVKGVAEGETAVFRVIGADEASHAVLTQVRVVSPPNDPNPTQTPMGREPATGALTYFRTSPSLGHGAAFRIEVDTSCNANPVPRGGGHFRVLDQGGGDPL